MASFLPLAVAVVPSTGSTTNSTFGPLPVPTFSLHMKDGAWSLGPSQEMTSPLTSVWLNTALENSTAFASTRFLSP